MHSIYPEFLCTGRDLGEDAECYSQPWGSAVKQADRLVDLGEQYSSRRENGSYQPVSSTGEVNAMAKIRLHHTPEKQAELDLLFFHTLYSADYINICPVCNVRAMGLDCLSHHLINVHRAKPELVSRYVANQRVAGKR